MPETKVPKGALRLVEHGQAVCVFAEEDELGKKKKPQMKMQAYTGGVIKGHWYWGNLSIDLDGMTFSGKKFPILENHMTDRKIAFTGRPLVEDNALNINPNTTKFVDTEYSTEFQKLSAEGFPYQASIYAKPLVIQRLAEKEVADVNGYQFKGPGTIWRKCEFKEASVCVFGWDSKTSSSAFSREETEDIDMVDYMDKNTQLADTDDGVIDDISNNSTPEGGENSMDLNTLKKDHPEVAAQLTEEVTQSVTAELTVKFNQERDGFQATIETQTDRIAQLEKNDAIRSERELAFQAETIFDSQLAQSDVSPHLFDKVKAMVKHSKFVIDGILDIAKFTEAVDAEISDWEGRGATQKVMGAGFARRQVDDNNGADDQQLAEENQSAVSTLLAKAGQKVD